MLDEYLHFFGQVAFGDHPQWAGCYCVHFHWNANGTRNARPNIT